MFYYDPPSDEELLNLALGEIALEKFSKRLENEALDYQRERLTRRDAGQCEACEATDGVEMRSSMTSYPWSGKLNADDDPNRDWLGCEDCWKDYEQHWYAMWDDYYAGLL